MILQSANPYYKLKPCLEIGSHPPPCPGEASRGRGAGKQVLQWDGTCPPGSPPTRGGRLRGGLSAVPGGCRAAWVEPSAGVVPLSPAPKLQRGSFPPVRPARPSCWFLPARDRHEDRACGRGPGQLPWASPHVAEAPSESSDHEPALFWGPSWLRGSLRRQDDRVCSKE